MNERDRKLTCGVCGEAFVFSAGEQQLLRVRGLDAEPERCPTCRRRAPTLPRGTRAH